MVLAAQKFRSFDAVKIKDDRLEIYRQFVSVEDEEDISKVFKKKNWPAIFQAYATLCFKFGNRSSGFWLVILR